MNIEELLRKEVDTKLAAARLKIEREVFCQSNRARVASEMLLLPAKMKVDDLKRELESAQDKLSVAQDEVSQLALKNGMRDPYKKPFLIVLLELLLEIAESFCSRQVP